MADPKQLPLNGAYYGPPVPPQQAHHSIGRRRSSGCGPCCLLCTLLKFLVAVIFVLGIIVLVLWLVFRPSRINVHVESATLSQFDLANNTNLDYDLSLNVSIRNPNQRVAFYYDWIEARAMYSGARFDYENLPPFYQDHKSSTVLQPVFKGRAGALGSVAETFNREKGEGNYYIQVKLYTSLRLKVWFIRIGHFKPTMDCVVKLPVPAKGKPVTNFERTECDVDIF